MKVLVCEDQRIINDDVSNTLVEKGYVVIQAFKRDEAIEKVNQHFFDIAVVDLNLEKKTNPIWRESGGIHVLKYIKNQNYGTIPIVLSGNPETRLAFELARDFGVQDYVAKGETDTEKKIINMVDEYSKKVKIRYPESSALFLSHLTEPNSREIWVTNCISSVSMSGGAKTLYDLFDVLLKDAYPMKLSEQRTGLIPDHRSKQISGKFWSLRHGCAIDIFILPKTAKNPSYDEIVKEEIIGNVRLLLFKSNMSYEEYMI